jgi:hypothetical protein
MDIRFNNWNEVVALPHRRLKRQQDIPRDSPGHLRTQQSNAVAVERWLAPRSAAMITSTQSTVWAQRSPTVEEDCALLSQTYYIPRLSNKDHPTAADCLGRMIRINSIMHSGRSRT